VTGIAGRVRQGWSTTYCGRQLVLKEAKELLLSGSNLGQDEVVEASTDAMIGLRGLRVERPEEVGPAWDEALRVDRPCVLDVKTDPKVPPLPPHITYDQAESYAQALLKGDPEALGLVWQSVKEGIQGILPSRH
jgi:hypothetical protein